MNGTGKPTGRIRVLLQQEVVKETNRGSYPSWTQLHTVVLDENSSPETVSDIIEHLGNRINSALGRI